MVTVSKEELHNRCLYILPLPSLPPSPPSPPSLLSQVPSRNRMEPDSSLGEFFEDVPALGLIGTPHQIYLQTPFVVDTDVQLVCKYLRAYRLGGTKGIDRLYKEGNGFCFFQLFLMVSKGLKNLVSPLLLPPFPLSVQFPRWQDPAWCAGEVQQRS